MSNQISELKSRHAQANKEIKATTANVAKLYEDVRLRLNQKLQSFVLKHNINDYQGKALVACIEGLQKEYAEFEAQFRKEMKRAIPYVAEGYYFDALHDMGEVLGKFDTKRVEAVIQDTYTHIAGMTQYMTGTTVQNLRNVVARTLRESAMSGMTQKEVSATLLDRLLASDSQFKFVDAKNRVWNTNAYVEMLSRTTMLNAGRETYLDTCAEKGKDVVRITVSGNACPKCAEWENRLVSISGKTKGLPTLQQAIDSGLFHPNCTHSTVAVGDYDRENNFDENGRPKKGYNSADNPNPKGTDKEANREYRRSLAGKAEKTPKTDKINTIIDDKQNKTYKSNKADGKEKKLHKEHRQEQLQTAYDNRRDMWYQDMLDNGVSQEIAGVLADLYTPKIAKLGKPPKIKVTKLQGKTFYQPTKNPKDAFIQIYHDSTDWYGYPDTARHEFTHWQHHQALRKNIVTPDEIKIAAQKDYDKFIENCKKNNISLSDFKEDKILDAIEKFIPDLKTCHNSNNMFKKSAIADIIGNLSNGKYGRGHKVIYYKQLNNSALAQSESLANLKVIKNYLNEDKFPYCTD